VAAAIAMAATDGPATAPAETGVMLWRKIMPRTRPGGPPTAMLTPISCVRCATEWPSAKEQYIAVTALAVPSQESGLRHGRRTSRTLLNHQFAHS
jgi:hypothetical protein